MYELFVNNANEILLVTRLGSIKDKSSIAKAAVHMTLSPFANFHNVNCS